MNKEQLFKRLNKTWVEFTKSYAGLSKSQLVKPAVTGDWSVKDIISHVTTWEREAVDHIPELLKGKRQPLYSVKYGGIDAFNAMMTERGEKLSLAEVLREQGETHARLAAYIETLPEDQFTTETRVRRRIRLDCYGHYPIHAKAIRSWRERTGI